MSTPGDPAAPKSCRLPVSGETCAWRGATIGPELPPSGLVPPLPFLPAATVFSTWHFSGFLHPETDPGVHQVSSFRYPLALPDSHSPRPKSFAVRVSSPALRRGPTPTVPLRPSHALPKMSERTSFATRRAGGFLQPFPLVLHPSKLSPRFQQIRVSRVSCPHTFLPRDLGKPEPTWTSSVLFGHRVRDTADLAFTPLVAGDNALGRSASRAARCRSCFPDLKALIRQRVRCDHQRCSWVVTRCSLGLRPSKACSIDAVPRHVSASRRPKPPLRTPRCPA